MVPPDRFSYLLPEDQFRFLLDLEIKRAYRYEHYLSVFILSLTGTDQHEHLYSCIDQVRGMIRETDDRGVIQGKKVASILPRVDPDELPRILSRIRPFLKTYSPCSSRQRCAYGLSIGGACCPRDGATARELLQAAERTCEPL